jgi:hypothetical protein
MQKMCAFVSVTLKGVVTLQAAHPGQKSWLAEILDSFALNEIFMCTLCVIGGVTAVLVFLGVFIPRTFAKPEPPAEEIV